MMCKSLNFTIFSTHTSRKVSVVMHSKVWKKAIQIK